MGGGCLFYKGGLRFDCETSWGGCSIAVSLIKGIQYLSLLPLLQL